MVVVPFILHEPGQDDWYIKYRVPLLGLTSRWSILDPEPKTAEKMTHKKYDQNKWELLTCRKLGIEAKVVHWMFQVWCLLLWLGQYNCTLLQYCALCALLSTAVWNLPHLTSTLKWSGGCENINFNLVGCGWLKSYQDYFRHHWECCFTHGLWSLGVKVLFLSVIRVYHYYRGGVEGSYSKEGALILPDIMWLLMGSGADTYGIRPVNDFLVPMRKYPAVFQAKITVISEYRLNSQGLNYQSILL